MPRIPQTNNVVPMQPEAQLPSPTMFAMAAAMMHQEGRLFEPLQQMAENDKPSVDRVKPIRSQKSLNDAIKNADSDEELEAIAKRLDKRGYDSSRVGG